MAPPFGTRFLVSLLLGIVLATVLTGCGDDGEDDADGPRRDPAEFAAESLATDPVPEVDGVDGDDDDGQDEALDPTEIPGEPINIFTLAVGDCFEQVADLDDGRPVTITTKVPCDGPHGYEIFHESSYPAEHPAPFPGETVVREFALQICYREFAIWVGTEYELSALDIGVIVPTQENFEDAAARYRGIHCWVERDDGDPMTGTSAGSGW